MLMAALTCGATFSMGEAYLAGILGDPDNLVWLVESAVLACNYLPLLGKPSDAISLQLMQ